MRRLLVLAITIGCLVILFGPDTPAQAVVDPVFHPGTETPSVLWQTRYGGTGVESAYPLHLDFYPYRLDAYFVRPCSGKARPG